MPGRNKILVVDNDNTFLFLMEEYFGELNEHGAFEIKLEDKASNAFYELEKGYQPHVIILDLNMPLINGLDFLDIYHSKGFHNSLPKTMIYILSSSTNPHEIDRAVNYPGVHKFVGKTNDESMLHEIINDYYSDRSLSEKLI